MLARPDIPAGRAAGGRRALEGIGGSPRHWGRSIRRPGGRAIRPGACHFMHLTPYAVYGIIRNMSWTVLFHTEFDAEFQDLAEGVQDELLERIAVLREFGPDLGRPLVDTLSDSSFPNMKELRFQADGVWRFAFAFDSQRQAVVLVGGDKQGVNERRFYKELIRIADERFAKYIASLSKTKRE
jgi:hypothetical protein